MVIHSSRFGKLNWSFDKRAPVNKNGKGKTKPQQKNPQPKNAKQPTLPLKKPQNTPEKTNDKNATPPLKVPQDTPGKTNDKIPKNKPNPEEGKTFPKGLPNNDKNNDKGKGKEVPTNINEPKPKKIEKDEFKMKDQKKDINTTMIGKMPPTMIPEKAPLPLEQGKSQTLSNVTIIVIGAIVFGVFLVAFIVYRKRSNSRKGAVRLYDNDDESQMNEKPRFIDKSTITSPSRIQSQPPTIQLTRLSSTKIHLNVTPSENNFNNNNYKNNYLFPYTNDHNLSSSNRITLGDYNDYNDYNIQGTTDYTQNYNDYYQTRNSYASSRESYSSSLGGAFPVPPRRISDNSVSTATPTSATFRDHNHFPKSYQYCRKSSFQN
ncbi:2135_t:CDS:2 [Funneliformis mosseae]|uniref:2135_t:CDS:1 n=1 Tax=Funneliformis mosseae TaxID=27381 RepID=A0A9N9CHV5_FUNMO|nr:2135_t:CDS:2 [Funneliformis mosseae]